MQTQIKCHNKSYEKYQFDGDSSFYKNNEVDQYLKALALQNNDLVILNPHQAILRRDHALLTNQVKVLSGGSSGNEPLHTGFVGYGLLTAAIMGPLNSCPSHTHILAVIKELSRNNQCGIFVIIMNYASHRLNFGLAINNAILQGIKIASVIVEDDCSGVIVDKTVGRRTLAGVLFMHKVVGAMAEEGKTLYEIECISKLISKNHIGSINVHIDKCNGKIIYGTGLQLDEGKLIIQSHPLDYGNIIQHALNFVIDPAQYFSIAVKKGDSVALLVNNFRSLSYLELAKYVDNTLLLLQNIPLLVKCLFFGNYLSSDTVLGFSITLFKINNPRIFKWLTNQSTHLKLFEMKTDFDSLYIDDKELLQNIITPINLNIGPKFNNEQFENATKILTVVMEEICSLEEKLNHLDFDHDFGTTLKKFCTEVLHRIQFNEIDIKTPYALLNSLSEIASFYMEGMSSGIFSVLFSGGAQVSLVYIKIHLYLY
uniref:DhaK domain-containing protein n=1 Tax=Clastoptera arizonana TaxID=38151 RepID=A0A1B6C3F8_9HEMI